MGIDDEDEFIRKSMEQSLNYELQGGIVAAARTIEHMLRVVLNAKGQSIYDCWYSIVEFSMVTASYDKDINERGGDQKASQTELSDKDEFSQELKRLNIVAAAFRKLGSLYSILDLMDDAEESTKCYILLLEKELSCTQNPAIKGLLARAYCTLSCVLSNIEGREHEADVAYKQALRLSG
jgi:hypothetical protein